MSEYFAGVVIIAFNCYNNRFVLCIVNSFTPIGAYNMRQLIKRASLLVYNFSKFCPLTMFDS